MDNLAPQHHAILIGVNYYKESPLRGAVQDVRDLEFYLMQTIPSIRLHTLTATSNDDPECPTPTEEPNQLPTCRNVIEKFKQVQQEARNGDFVYIHFSGHGIASPEGQNSDGSGQNHNLALALLGERKETKLFNSSMLAYLINCMIEKEVKVTLVLDCCFSATVHRGSTIRRLLYDPKYEVEPPLPGQSIVRGSREVNGIFQFMKNSEDYAFFVASGPDQKAQEVQISGTDKFNGKLSYFLLSTLKTGNDLTLPAREIFGRIAFEFRHGDHDDSGQHPVLYGNEQQPFFGRRNIRAIGRSAPAMYEPWYYEVDVMEGATLSIKAGVSQAIGDGDMFKLYPSRPAASGQWADGVVARVTSVTAFTTEIEPVDQALDLENIQWRAMITSQSALRELPVKLSPALPNIQEWVTELKQCSLSSFLKPDAPDSFLLVDIDGDAYVIRHSTGQPVINLPAMTRLDTSIHQMCKILEHLTRFQLVKSLQNRQVSAEFNRSFKTFVRVEDAEFSDSEIIPIVNRHRADLVFENQGPHTLFVSIYNLGPRWNVTNVTKETYFKIAPRDGPGYPKSLTRRFTLEIPQVMVNQGHQSCVDILKIFVTSHPAWLYNLQLPKLDEYLALEMGQTRHSTVADVPEAWTVRNFQFHTRLS